MQFFRDRPLGWAFAPTASVGAGLVSGAVFSAGDNAGFLPAGLVATLASAVVTAAFVVIGSRGSGVWCDAALGFGSCGFIAAVVVGSAISGGT